MYNLTVDEAHTFFVGDGQWLVHNTCDFRRILYGSDEMSRAAQQFRLDLGLKEGGNIAVFQMDGLLPQSLLDYINRSPKWNQSVDDMLIARNVGSNGDHAEKVLKDLLDEFRVNPSRVSAVYTEFSPCSTFGHNCLGLLNEIGRYRDYLPVTYSFRYPNEKALKNIATSLLFEKRLPRIIKP